MSNITDDVNAVREEKKQTEATLSRFKARLEELKEESKTKKPVLAEYN